MIKKHYTGMERRAENIIWNTAGRYDFDPPFMAFLENGRPDFYFNMIIGLAYRWLDVDALTAFFARYAGSHRAEEYDELLWLGIENCLYEKEAPHRPVMKKLREEKARLFFRNQQTLSRQQMMLQSMLLYEQQEIRWKKVLGERQEILSGRERSLARALEFPGDLDTRGLLAAMERVLRDELHFRIPTETSGSGRKEVSGAKARFLRRVLHREDHYRDTLIVRNGTAEGDRQGAAQLTHAVGDRKSVQDYETDLLYIRKSLGDSILSDADLRMLENNLCVKNHAYCRLWVTDGRGVPSRQAAAVKQAPAGAGGTGPDEESAAAQRMSGRDARDLEQVQRDSAAQGGRNRAWLQERMQLVNSNVRRLSARMDEVLSSYERALPEEARAGRLESEKAYRLPVLQDPDVFTRAGDETERSVTIDILLDASASRLNYQEQLAGEAYMIAKACQTVHVPVQVECFRSLRGFTVLQILKNRSSRDCSHILDYFAGGWNRDGLGLRVAENFLPDKREAALRILLVLTDASPNDSTRVPPEKGDILDSEYQGRTAVLDARDAVAGLRQNGVRTAAVFLGPTLYMENLHTIYGKECVRIHRIEQLEEAVADLLEMILREQKNG